MNNRPVKKLHVLLLVQKYFLNLVLSLTSVSFFCFSLVCFFQKGKAKAPFVFTEGTAYFLFFQSVGDIFALFFCSCFVRFFYFYFF